MRFGIINKRGFRVHIEHHAEFKVKELAGMADESVVVLPRAYYKASIEEFLATSPEAVLGHLVDNSEFAVELPQRDAWLYEIELLRDTVQGLSGTIFFEFSIPRMGRRVDVALIVGGTLFVLEFKVGAKHVLRSDLEQVWDYALDLKNFHKGSHDIRIFPVLIATESALSAPGELSAQVDKVWSPVACGSKELWRIIDLGRQDETDSPIDADAWVGSPYHPTPTIIEAAQALYAQHSVDAIARNDAGAKNLRITSRRLEELADEARATHRKVICFVTGVPGSGKTLVGLNVATKRGENRDDTHAVFLSGNGPLVAVLREALTRDEVGRRRRRGESVSKGKVGESVKAFIQNVHHFRDEALRDARPPIDHVVIFDEAQRAWNLEQTARFMRIRKRQHGFSYSEPEFLLSYLDRHNDWSVVVCLVGGGQEINTGEAGIGAWIEPLMTRFKGWGVYISPELTDSEYAAGHAIELLHDRPYVEFDRDLHLAVSMRSFRAENVSRFVKAVLDCDIVSARSAFASFNSRYPIAITRRLDIAKSWVRNQARGTERFGLVASSEAQRLKPHAIDVRVEIDPIHWFLSGKDDTRSSYYLEDAATEFQVQGLELDWICVTWDGDLRYRQGAWGYHSFRGSQWQNINKSERQSYLLNAYRVLLTRARQGMVIFVPPGDPADPTRKSEYYDATYQYLVELGLPVLS